MRTFTSRVNVHVLCVEGALGLGGHVVVGVVSLHNAYAIPSVEFFPLDVAVLVVVRLYSVIVNFICSQIIAHFCIAKEGHLRCCLYIPEPGSTVARGSMRSS